MFSLYHIFTTTPCQNDENDVWHETPIQLRFLLGFATLNSGNKLVSHRWRRELFQGYRR